MFLIQLLNIVIAVVAGYYAQQYFLQNHAWRVRDPQLFGLLIFIVVMLVSQAIVGPVLYALL